MDIENKYKYVSEGYNLYEAYKLDPRLYNREFANYMIRSMGFSISEVKFFNELVRRGKKDIDLFNIFMEKVGKMRLIELKDKERIGYNKRMIREANKVVDFIENIIGKREIAEHLDIGTEDIGFLEGIMNRYGCKSYGINIGEGEVGSLAYGRSGNIIEYDGVNIPIIDDKNDIYDLITIRSVMHHIPEDNLEKLMDSISLRCGKYLYVKENDITNKFIETYFLWQHYLWTGIISPDNFGFTRSDLNKKKICDALQSRGFKLIGENYTNTFTKACNFLFEKM